MRGEGVVIRVRVFFATDIHGSEICWRKFLNAAAFYKADMVILGGDVTGNGISKLVFTILSAVAENERDRIRERVRDAKRHRVSQRLYNGGKRPFGFDVVGGSLVPNADEQAALALGRALRDEGKSYRDIAEVWASELGMPKVDAKSIQRMLARRE